MLDLKLSIPDRAVKALERIADALERVSRPPQHLAPGFKKRDATSVSTYGDNESLWNREQLHTMATKRGLSAATEEQLAKELRSVTKDDLPPELL